MTRIAKLFRSIPRYSAFFLFSFIFGYFTLITIGIMILGICELAAAIGSALG